MLNLKNLNQLARTIIVLIIILGGTVYAWESSKTNLLFSHPPHLELLKCQTCHGSAESSARAGMPDRNSCNDCHPEADHSQPPTDACRKCHNLPGQKAAILLPESFRYVIFNHKPHTRNVPESCNLCHLQRVPPDSSPQIQLPGKNTHCRKCHQNQISRKEGCQLCHSEGIKTHKPQNHDHPWNRQHGVTARAVTPDKRWYQCNFCHQENFCNHCHRKEPPRSHNESFRLRFHGVQAETDRFRCQTCHQDYECLRCHTRALSRPTNAIHRGNPNCLTCHSTSPHLFWTDNCEKCHRSPNSSISAILLLPRHNHHDKRLEKVNSNLISLSPFPSYKI